VILREDRRAFLLGSVRHGDGLLEHRVHDVEVSAGGERDLHAVVGEGGGVGPLAPHATLGFDRRITLEPDVQACDLSGLQVETMQVEAPQEDEGGSIPGDPGKEHAVILEVGELHALVIADAGFLEIPGAGSLIHVEIGLRTRPDRPAAASLPETLELPEGAGLAVEEPDLRLLAAPVPLAVDGGAFPREEQARARGVQDGVVAVAVEEQLRFPGAVEGLDEDAPRVAPEMITGGAHQEPLAVRGPPVEDVAFRVQGDAPRRPAGGGHHVDLGRAVPGGNKGDFPSVGGEAGLPVPGGVEGEALHGAALGGDAPEVAAPGKDDPRPVRREGGIPDDPDGSALLGEQ